MRLALWTHRFWLKVWLRGDCWEWRGPIDPDGYGQFWIGAGQETVRAHRMAYELAKGTIPPGDGNRRKTHCANGHEFNRENTYQRKDRPGRICLVCQRDRLRESRAVRSVA